MKLNVAFRSSLQRIEPATIKTSCWHLKTKLISAAFKRDWIHSDFEADLKKLSRYFPTVIFWADIFPHFSFLRLKCLFVIIFVPINFLVNFLTSYDYFGSVSNQFCCGGIFVHAICFQTSSPTYSGAADMGLDIGAVCKREDIVESGPPYWRLDSVYLRKCQCTAQPTLSGRNSLRGLLETLFWWKTAIRDEPQVLRVWSEYCLFDAT